MHTHVPPPNLCEVGPLLHCSSTESKANPVGRTNEGPGEVSHCLNRLMLQHHEHHLDVRGCCVVKGPEGVLPLSCFIGATFHYSNVI